MKEWVKSPRSPYQLIFTGYAIIIALGTFLLLLPVSTRTPISFIDALYTATSATCVTGLIVKNTALDFTLFGKFVILFLIQTGGIGYMTFSTILFLLLGRGLSLTQRMLVKESMNYLSYENLSRFALNVLKVTLVLEGIGFLLLSIYFLFIKHMGIGESFFQALFHSVSAFCNAGFSTFSTNLAVFSKDVFVPMVISILFIMGGLGFIVITELYRRFIKKQIFRLSIHTKLVLTITFFLIIMGTLVIFVAEYNNTLKGYPLLSKLIIAYFHAVTPRTAGFNLINIADMGLLSIIVIIILMFIGASPGGTGGGIKTTTAAVVFYETLRIIRREDKIVIFGRTVKREHTERAISIFILSIFLILTSLILVILFENGMYVKNILFEVFSAFGTVGLSMVRGVSVSYSYFLSWQSKLVIIFTMLFGKIGVLSMVLSLVGRKKRKVYPVEEDIVVG